jgi:hypothetical protein
LRKDFLKVEKRRLVGDTERQAYCRLVRELGT